MDPSRDKSKSKSDDPSSHTLTTELERQKQQHAAPAFHTISSSASDTTQFGEKELGKGIHNGDADGPPAAENTEVKEEAQDTKPVEKEKEKDPNLIGWEGPNDPQNPQNWPNRKKYTITVLYSTLTFTLTFSSSIFSTATQVTSKEFGVSTEVMTLGTALIVLGFAVGPMLWGPLSELYGRKPPLFIGYFIFAIFQIPVAVARNIETIMLFRFLQGVFGASTMAVIGGALADFWGPVERGLALGLFTGATFIGPVAGPIAGGFIVMNHNLGWRWTSWMTLILALAFWLLALVVCSESYAPVILQRKASKLRFKTKNWALHAPADEQRIDIWSIAERYLLRPFAMMVREPILLLITLYMSFIYGDVYLFFEAYPIAFQEQRHWNLGVGALPFLGITLGVMIGVVIIVYTSHTRFKRKMIANGGKPIPEERLIPMIVGAIFLPIGLFWFAWTSSPHVHWAPQVLAGIPIGVAVELILLQGMSYIIDVYLMYANSALAGNTLVRSLAGGGFPMFAAAMYHNLGVDWATSLLGFLALAFLPCPVLFFIYGKKIRGWRAGEEGGERYEQVLDHDWIDHAPPQAGKETDWFSVQCLYAIVISAAAEMLYNQRALRQSPAEREQKLKTAYEFLEGWRSHLPAPLQEIHKQDMHLILDDHQMRDIALSIFRQYHEAIFMIYFPRTGSQADGRVSEDYRRKSVGMCVNSAQVVLAIANQISNLDIFDSKFLELTAVSICIIFLDVATRSNAKKSISYMSMGCGIFGRLNILDNEVPLVDVLDLTRTAQQITRK